MSAVGLLGVCLVVMKIVGLIDWNWWLVTLPFWGGFVVVCACYIILELLKAFRK